MAGGEVRRSPLRIRLGGLCAAVLIGASAPQAQEPVLKEIKFTAGREDYPNPERGWYRYREMSASGSFDFNVRAQKGTLLFLKIRADAWRNADLPASLLARLQAAFDQARKDGVKLMPRVAYNDGPSPDCTAEYGCDAPKSVILRHIAQLAPLWKRNKDVINLIDPGFIGGWGEWHSSSNGLDNKKDRTDILFAILDSLPADRMVYIRYPAAKREIFGGSATSETEILDAARAFNGSRLSRVGHLNDCFLSSPTDVGTYDRGWTTSRELAYIAKEAPFTPMGGETCALHARSECANALAEMAALHTDHLNQDYFGGVIDRWRQQGCMDTISLRLGHRLALDWARLPDSVKPGGLLRLRFAARNHGFGELFNPRELEAVLYREGRLESAVLPVDPRRWAGGTVDTVEVSLSVPASLPEGAWRLGLRLADKDTALRKDPRYSIRFANPGWNEATGINDIKTDLQVSAKAPGAADPAVTKFEAVKEGTWIRAGSGNAPGWRLTTGEGGRMRIIPPSGVAGPLEARIFTLSGTLLSALRLDGKAGGYVLPTVAWPKGILLLSVHAGDAHAQWTLVSKSRR